MKINKLNINITKFIMKKTKIKTLDSASKLKYTQSKNVHISPVESVRIFPNKGLGYVIKTA